MWKPHSCGTDHCHTSVVSTLVWHFSVFSNLADCVGTCSEFSQKTFVLIVFRSNIAVLGPCSSLKTFLGPVSLFWLNISPNGATATNLRSFSLIYEKMFDWNSGDVRSGGNLGSWLFFNFGKTWFRWTKSLNSGHFVQRCFLRFFRLGTKLYNLNTESWTKT